MVEQKVIEASKSMEAISHLTSANTEIAEMLKKINESNGELSKKDVEEIFAKYFCAFWNNFQLWLATAGTMVRGEEVRAIVLSNLMQEYRDQHQQKLYSCLESLWHHTDADIDVEPYDLDIAMEASDGSIWQIIQEGTALSVLATIALLENASVSFIPLLYEYVNIFTTQGSEGIDYDYLNVHGVEDMKHSIALNKAVGIEAEYWDDISGDIDDAKIVVSNLLESIFKKVDSE